MPALAPTQPHAKFCFLGGALLVGGQFPGRLTSDLPPTAISHCCGHTAPLRACLRPSASADPIAMRRRGGSALCYYAAAIALCWAGLPAASASGTDDQDAAAASDAEAEADAGESLVQELTGETFDDFIREHEYSMVELCAAAPRPPQLLPRSANPAAPPPLPTSPAPRSAPLTPSH